MATQPTLTVIAGPNGSGKTTALNFLRRAGVEVPTYWNADEVAKSLEGEPLEIAIRAQLIVREARDEAIKDRVPFSYESVMSHPSHVEAMRKARDAGFFVRLIFITTDDPALNVRRVAERVEQGGHDVPTETIVRRYGLIFRDTLLPAVQTADESFLFDTTYGQADAPEPAFVAHIQQFYVARFEAGKLTWATKLKADLRALGQYEMPAG